MTRDSWVYAATNSDLTLLYLGSAPSRALPGLSVVHALLVHRVSTASFSTNQGVRRAVPNRLAA